MFVAMKCVILTLLVLAARTQSQTCPPASPSVGICVIGPNSCTSDENCGTDKICCSEGCGKECKTPLSNAQMCPTPPPLAATSCVAPVTDSCQDNSECKEGQLCCKHPCGKRCQAPAGSGGIFPLPPIEPVIRPGSCPVPASGFLVRCANIDQCVGDSACPGTQKCCKTACGKRCTDIVKTKVGTCPVANTKPACDKMGDNCYKDGDCSGTQKCCKTSCGNRCLAQASTVIITRPGVCRVLPPGVAVKCALTPDTCSQDGECPGVQRCCQGPCSKSCQDTVKPKAGTCPTQPLGIAVLCEANTRDECSQDNHCSAAKKCCKGPCSKYCADPAVVKPGNCPKLPPSAFLVKCLSFDRCQNDGECPKTQKCCRQGCGNRCVEAESADAPVPTVECLPYPCPGPCEHGVENDANGCPSCTCKPAPATEAPKETTKPGVCRNIRFRFRFRCRFRRDLCKNDSGCRGSRKCCQLTCGKRCRRPLRRTKRGQCPPKPATLPCLIHQNDCKSDDNCPDGKKCCATTCGIGCVDPNFTLG